MISRYKCAGMYGMIAGLVGWLIVMGSLPTPTAAQDATQTQFAWITYGGFRPLDKPRHDSEARFGARPFQFMQKVAIRASDQSDKNYYEVGKLSETGTQFQEIYGWVPQDHFITKSQCLQKKGTTLDEKLLTVFRLVERGQLLDAAPPQSASAPELSAKPGEQVQFRAAPGTNAEVLGQYDLFNIFWIFQHVTIKDAEQGRERTYLLAGAGPKFNPNPRDESEMPTSVVKGWVDERQVLTWSTRMARQWDRQSTLPGQTARRDREGWVYKSPADAYAHAYPEIYRNVLSQEPPSVKYAFVEVFKTDPQLGRVSLEYEPYQMRYPVIDDDLAKKFFDMRFPEVHPQGQQVNKLEMIGAFGGFAGMSNQEIDKMRKYVDNLKQAMKQTEILFVIDDTASMNFSETRDAIAVAIHSIIEEAEQKSQSEVLIAPTFFNDTDGHEPGWVPVITRKLEPVKQFGQTIVDIVRRHDLSYGGDAREMVFFGLKKGIEDAEFTPNARRLVVLIGDAGDKSDENDLAEIKKLAEWFEPEREAPIEFLAIQMRLVIESPGTREAANALTMQCQRLVEELNNRKKYRDSKRTLGRLVQARNIAQIGEFVAEGYHEIQQDIDRIEREMNEIARGNFHAKCGEDIEALMKHGGYDLKRFREASKQRQVQPCHEGFVWTNFPTPPGAEPIRLTRDYALLSANEIKILTNVLGKVVDWRTRGLYEGGTPKKAMETLVKALAGQLDDSVGYLPSYYPNQSSTELSFSHVLLKRMGIKANTPLLNLPPNDLGDTLPPGDLAQIELRVGRLEDILKGQEREWTPEKIQDPAGQTYIAYKAGATTRTMDRSFPISGSPAKWYWIDLETEIP